MPYAAEHSCPVGLLPELNIFGVNAGGIMTTTELVIETAAIRISQIEPLVEWLAYHYPEQEDLIEALAALEAARATLEGLNGGSG